jgi:hypothetical protein
VKTKQLRPRLLVLDSLVPLPEQKQARPETS